MVDFKNHLALITGGTGGIGGATCLVLASLGCNIAVHYNSATQKAETLVKELRSKGIKAESFRADLSNYDNVRKLHCDVVEKIGDPVILFNNAGTTLQKSGIKASPKSP